MFKKSRFCFKNRVLFEIAYGVYDRWGSEKNEYPKEDEFWGSENNESLKRDEFWSDVITVRKCPLVVCPMIQG